MQGSNLPRGMACRVFIYPVSDGFTLRRTIPLSRFLFVIPNVRADRREGELCLIEPQSVK